jgi:hypothetical protein
MSTKEKNPLEVLFEGLDKGLLTEDAKAKMTTLINETVEARVGAKTKLLTEETEALKTKLTEEASALQKKLSDEAEANEKVLVEQAEKYKNELEKTVVEETLKYKAHVEKQRDDDIAKFRTEVQEMVLQEAKDFKNKQDAALVEEVKNFKAAMVDKVSDYLEAKLQETIPAEIMESAAELAVIKPLVQGINEAFSKNFIKLDTSSYSLIKEAKDEIAKLQAVVQEKSKNEIALKKENREVQRNMKIKSLTEGLIPSQKEKAVKLLESVEVENLEAHYAKIRDIIIEGKAETKPVVEETQKLDESNKNVTKPAASKPTPIADSAVVKHQVTAVLQALNETDVKANKASGATQKVVNESANPAMGDWAKKIKPGYREDSSKK